MNVNSYCPCCSSSMLLHISSRRSFWLCSHCRVEIPNSPKPTSPNKSTSIKFNSSALKAAIAPLESVRVVAVV